MALPFFYIADFAAGQKEIEVDEENSRHIVQVLRMRTGEKLNLTDGKGHLFTCELTSDHKKHCQAKIISTGIQPGAERRVTIAISLIKNASRFEWFLEKATEIGISRVIPLICERTERQKFRFDRMQSICVSAMLQSQQCWLPELDEPVVFTELIQRVGSGQKFIAHCEGGDKQKLSSFQPFDATTILIGPEGDFSSREIEMALQKGFLPVSLGETRLRSETAGVVAAVILNLMN